MKIQMLKNIGATLILALGMVSSAQAEYKPETAEPDASTPTTPTEQWTGKPVTLRIGKGFSLSAAGGIKSVLEEDGCPVTVTNEGSRFKRLTVDVENDSESFYL